MVISPRSVRAVRIASVVTRPPVSVSAKLPKFVNAGHTSAPVPLDANAVVLKTKIVTVVRLVAAIANITVAI
jgi:hypothetical protein